LDEETEARKEAEPQGGRKPGRAPVTPWMSASDQLKPC
jgi:hypothetical protein